MIGKAAAIDANPSLDLATLGTKLRQNEPCWIYETGLQGVEDKAGKHHKMAPTPNWQDITGIKPRRFCQSM